VTNFLKNKLSLSCSALETPTRTRTLLKIHIATLLWACASLQPMAMFAFGNSGGGISGTVKDPADRLVPNASVEVREVTTNLLYTTHTNAHQRTPTHKDTIRCPSFPSVTTPSPCTHAALRTIAAPKSRSTPMTPSQSTQVFSSQPEMKPYPLQTLPPTSTSTTPNSARSSPAAR
jgi:hypothetical protein